MDSPEPVRTPPAGGPRLWLGTSSWSHASWVGHFYPKDSGPGDYIRHYAETLPTVEIDATFYREPTARMVSGWKEKTPESFRFAAKVPRVITHEKLLVDCDEEFKRFVSVMEGLGDRLGPLLLQFRYFRKNEMSLDDFLARLRPFLERLPGGPRFALEVRNKTWVQAPLLDLLSKHGVALTWIDHPWFLDPETLLSRPGTRTAEFGYVRWLGDRVAIEKITTEWNRTVIDRTARLQAWVRALRSSVPREFPVFGYFNNHFAGYSIESIDLFRRLWREPGSESAGGS
ncbi:MAG: DUF72 domain-containing protein [Acidobacteriota bacterium]